MAMNEQDYNRYRKWADQQATKQAPAAQFQGYQSPVTQPTAGQQNTSTQQAAALPRSYEEDQAWADRMRQYQQDQAERQAYSRQYGQTFGGSPTVSQGDDGLQMYGRVDTRPQSISPEEQAWTNSLRQTQARGSNYISDPFKYGRVDTRPWMSQGQGYAQQTQAYPGQQYQRTPYQQVLDDYDVTSYPATQQSSYQGAPRRTNYGGAPMPNRGNTGSTAWRMPSQALMRSGEQAQYTTLPDRNPGQAQMTPYSNSGMNRKMNYRGR